MASGFRRIRGSSIAVGLITTSPPQVQAGTATPGGTSGTVVFPLAFLHTPKVQATAICGGGYNLTDIRVTSESTTGFSWACYGISAGNEAPTLVTPTKLTWEAIE